MSARRYSHRVDDVSGLVLSLVSRERADRRGAVLLNPSRGGESEETAHVEESVRPRSQKGRKGRGFWIRLGLWMRMPLSEDHLYLLNRELNAVESMCHQLMEAEIILTLSVIAVSQSPAAAFMSSRTPFGIYRAGTSREYACITIFIVA